MGNATDDKDSVPTSYSMIKNVLCFKCGSLFNVMEMQEIWTGHEMSVFACSECYKNLITKDLNRSEVKD